MSAVQASRRSQEERSAATRQLLLDATIECLIEFGYAGTSTTEIVGRAGVSRGAQVHHFPTKNDLVQSAVAHLALRQDAELRRQFARVKASGDRVSQAIDVLWSAFTGPLFVAGIELIVAARTDPSLREALAGLEAGIASGIRLVCDELFGSSTMRRRSARDAVDLTIGMMHGLAFGRLVDGSRERENRLLETWKRAIRPLLEEKGETRG
jgi:AcrR family transcriptional regulator